MALATPAQMNELSKGMEAYAAALGSAKTPAGTLAASMYVALLKSMWRARIMLCESITKTTSDYTTAWTRLNKAIRASGLAIQQALLARKIPASEQARIGKELSATNTPQVLAKLGVMSLVTASLISTITKDLATVAYVISKAPRTRAGFVLETLLIVFTEMKFMYDFIVRNPSAGDGTSQDKLVASLQTLVPMINEWNLSINDTDREYLFDDLYRIYGVQGTSIVGARAPLPRNMQAGKDEVTAVQLYNMLASAIAVEPATMTTEQIAEALGKVTLSLKMALINEKVATGTVQEKAMLADMINQAKTSEKLLQGLLATDEGGGAGVISGTNKWLLWGALGVGAILLLNRRK